MLFTQNIHIFLRKHTSIQGKTQEFFDEKTPKNQIKAKHNPKRSLLFRQINLFTFQKHPICRIRKTIFFSIALNGIFVHSKTLYFILDTIFIFQKIAARFFKPFDILSKRPAHNLRNIFPPPPAPTHKPTSPHTPSHQIRKNKKQCHATSPRPSKENSVPSPCVCT